MPLLKMYWGLISMKAYGVQIDPHLIGYNSAIRNKSGIVKLLINIVRYLIIYHVKPLEELTIQDSTTSIVLILNVAKMSRILICENDKIHTFQFPFNLIISDDNTKIYYNHIELDSGILAILSTTFIDLDDGQSIEKILENYWEAISNLEIDENDVRIYSGLITYLLSFEPGYLRFDYDDNEDRANVTNHPVNHLDIYYTNNNTFKIGLNNKLNYNQMIDILDITKPCLSIK